MTKKNFIALADAIKAHNDSNPFTHQEFTGDQISTLADFCESQNPAFNRARWLGYIAATNGKNGGERFKGGNRQ